MNNPDFSYKRLLKNILTGIAKKKIQKLLEYVAIHQEKFLKGNHITVPIKLILDDKENTTELITLIVSMFENNYRWLNIHASDRFFVITLSENAN